jgi:hypothetical protein
MSHALSDGLGQVNELNRKAQINVHLFSFVFILTIGR